MAPKKNLAGKAVEKKIAAPKKTIQKRAVGKTKPSAQPKSEPQAAVVKQEPMSPREMPPSAESAGIGMQRGRVSALLTSLKYQMNAKNILRSRRRTQPSSSSATTKALWRTRKKSWQSLTPQACTHLGGSTRCRKARTPSKRSLRRS